MISIISVLNYDIGSLFFSVLLLSAMVLLLSYHGFKAKEMVL